MSTKRIEHYTRIYWLSTAIITVICVSLIESSFQSNCFRINILRIFQPLVSYTEKFTYIILLVELTCLDFLADILSRTRVSLFKIGTMLRFFSYIEPHFLFTLFKKISKLRLGVSFWYIFNVCALPNQQVGGLTYTWFWSKAKY